MKTMLLASVAVALGVSPLPAPAATQTYLCETVLTFGTGMSSGGSKLRDGAADPNFEGVSANFPSRPDALVPTNTPSIWLADGASTDSQWIAPILNPAGAAAGSYTYRLRFTTPCGGANVVGRYAASDRGVLRLNGAAASFSTPGVGYTNWTGFSFNNLAAGLNTLEFYVTNAPTFVGLPGPSGLRAELRVVATCCPCIALNCPTDFVVTTCSNSAPVVFSVTGTNRCYTNLFITCLPPSGSVFSAGPHTVICTARDTAGHTTNCSFTVTVVPAVPVILQQPQGVLAMAEGGSHALRVVAANPENCGSLRYQWRRDGSNLPGATRDSLALNPLTLDKAGDYSVAVGNTAGASTSSVAVVRVLPGSDPDGVLQRVFGSTLWQFAPTRGHVFTNEHVASLRAQASSNLVHWDTLHGSIFVENGVIQIIDPLAALYPHRFYRLLSGDPPTPPPAMLDSAAEVPVSNLSTQTLALAQEHVQGFIGNPDLRGEDERDWENVSFAPIARYLHDPGYQNGAVPAYVELKILGPKGPADARGYIIVSLTDEDFPITEFATRGHTKTDRVLKESAGGTVRKFVRFNPAYIVGEDAAGRRLGAFGTEPLTLVDSLPPSSQIQVASYNSDTGQRVLPPWTSLNAAPLMSHEALKTDFQSNPARLQFRSLRREQAASRWRLAKGSRNPTLRVGVGQKLDFLTSESLASVKVESDGDPTVVEVQLRAGGGMHATGLRLGTELVRVQDQAGRVEHYTVLVTDGPAFAAAGGCEGTEVHKWYAGSGWDGDQRQYHQLKRDRWCPNVGCGPVALAMLFGWWDVNGVPSAFYRLKSGKGDKDNFRLHFGSLRDSDAPKHSDGDDEEDIIVPLYDDVYGLCNVICNPFGDSGGTYPDQMASAFVEYVERISKAQPSPEDEFGEKFVSVAMSASWVAPGLGMTDWEGGGTLVANGIKDGRPGIVGIGSTLFDAHYPLAYGYKRIDEFEGCGSDRELVDRRRYFKCNMGWGWDDPPEWHNAEDVWFGLTAQFWQISTPTAPSIEAPSVPTFLIPNLKTDPRRPAAAFSATAERGYLIEMPGRSLPGDFGRLRSLDGAATWGYGYNQRFSGGVFQSGPAVVVSSNGLKLHAFGRGMDKRIWRAYSPNGAASWTAGWVPVGPERVFNSAPAAAISGDGNKVQVFALGTDRRFYRASSSNGGSTWSSQWQPVLAGEFKSSPAAVSSADGQRLYLFGVGNDKRIWWAYSLNGGNSWVGWGPILEGVFTSAPAAATDATGQKLYVFGRGGDHRFYWAYSVNGGNDWVGWGPILEGVFSSAPGAAASADGRIIHVFGRGLPEPPPPPGSFSDPADPRIWRAYSTDAGVNWHGWGEIFPFSEIVVE